MGDELLHILCSFSSLHSLCNDDNKDDEEKRRNRRKESREVENSHNKLLRGEILLHFMPTQVVTRRLFLLADFLSFYVDYFDQKFLISRFKSALLWIKAIILMRVFFSGIWSLSWYKASTCCITSLFFNPRKVRHHCWFDVSHWLIPKQLQPLLELLSGC